MTRGERQRVTSFVNQVDQKLRVIDRNVRLLITLKDMEVFRLREQLARLRRRREEPKRATRRARRG